MTPHAGRPFGIVYGLTSGCGFITNARARGQHMQSTRSFITLSPGPSKLIDFGAGEEETTGAVVVEIGHGIICHWLSVFRLLPGALHVSEETVGMHGFFHHGVPGFSNDGQISFTV